MTWATIEQQCKTYAQEHREGVSPEEVCRKCPKRAECDMVACLLQRPVTKTTKH